MKVEEEGDLGSREVRVSVQGRRHKRGAYQVMVYSRVGF